MATGMVAQRLFIGLLAAGISGAAIHSAFAQNDGPDLAHKYVATDKSVKALDGSAGKLLPDGRLILGGSVGLSDSNSYDGVAWLACVGPDGQVMWAARAQDQAEHASLFPLATDGNSIWNGGLLKSGLFRLGKFEARTLRKELSIGMMFEPTDPGPFIHLHSKNDRNFDLQVSIVQCLRDSIRVAVFSKELRLLIDKVYGNIPLSRGTSWDAYLARIPTGAGYYLCLRRPVRSDAKTGGAIGILRLDNNGAVKWANAYVVGSREFEVEPRVTDDGSIVVSLGGSGGSSRNALLFRIGLDGNVMWSTSFDTEMVALADFNFGWRPYRFTAPYLFASGAQLVSTHLYSLLFAINYETGQLEKQVKFGPGAIGFAEKTGDGLYVTMLGIIEHRAALLRFDFDLNLRASRAIRNPGAHWPPFELLPSGKFLASYGYHEQKTLMVETVNQNFESNNLCDFLQKADFSVTKTKVQARPFKVTVAPLPSISVSAANSKTSEAELSLVPMAFTGVACKPATEMLPK